MSKYIDAEKLKAEIERRRLQNRYIDTEGYENELLEIIDSLQQERPNCHTVEDWIHSIKNADQLTKDIFSKGPYDVLYDALNHPYQHCYDAIKEFGELCFQTGMNSVKQEQQEVDLDEEINRFWNSCIKHKNERGGNVIWSNKLEVEVLARHFYELGKNSK